MRGVMFELVTVDGYDIGFTIENGKRYVCIPITEDPSDPEYIQAVILAQSSFDSVENFNRLDMLRYYWYSSASDREQLDINEVWSCIVKLKESNLSEPKWLEKFVSDISSGKPDFPRYKHVRKQVKGYIYLIKHQDGMYKIGRTKDLKSRMKAYETSMPFTQIELIATMESDDYMKDERDLHAEFSEKQIRGEWFDLTEKEVDNLRERFSGNDTRE